MRQLLLGPWEPWAVEVRYPGGEWEDRWSGTEEDSYVEAHRLWGYFDYFLQKPANREIRILNHNRRVVGRWNPRTKSPLKAMTRRAS